MNISKKQNRHERLVDFLNQFSQYQFEGRGVLKKVKDQRTSGKIKEITTNEINNAVVVLVDVLNLYGGSNGDMDLYRLLQAYFMVPEYRERFNELVSEAKSFSYAKNGVA